MNDIQQFQDGSAIIGDGALPILIDYKLVHATRTQGSPNSIHNNLACIYIGCHLLLSLGRVRSFLQQDYMRLLQLNERKIEILNISRLFNIG